jgi:hypothetical protein
MCCPLCEEPVRSTLFGLAAVGLIALFRMAARSIKGWRTRSMETRSAETGAS